MLLLVHLHIYKIDSVYPYDTEVLVIRIQFVSTR